MKARKFLVIKLGAIGDVVHAIPAVALLRQIYPDSTIDWLIEKKSASVLRGNPYISSSIVIDTKRWRRELFRHPIRVIMEVRGVLDRLKRARYDVAIDLQGLIKSSLLAWASKSRLRFGYPSRECREGLSARLTNRKCWHAIEKDHVVEKHGSMVAAIAEELGDMKPGSALPLLSDLMPLLPIEKAARDAFREYLSEKGFRRGEKLIGVNPCAAWTTKRWPPANFARMIDAVRDAGVGAKARFVLLYGPNERDAALEVLSHLSDHETDRVFLAPPSDIPLLCAILAACDLVVSGDTSVLHIAAALKTPTVALFGPSDPKRNGPYGNRSIVLQHIMACGPCYKRQCNDMACIKNISPRKAAEAVLQILG
ncbi:MAG: glycosyltransferase family 9 protein [Candidatus Coatesbacteria bacterium]|nr:glycosyltransferase family 9 protein [Candidatus Coatesbacteria bacterium]